MKRLSYVMGGKYQRLRKSAGMCLQEAAVKTPNKEVAVFMKYGMRWTYAELRQRAEEVAQGLLNLGLPRKARVGVFSPNTPECMVTQYAASLADMTIANIYAGFRRDDLKHILNTTECEALVTYPGLMGVDYVQMLHDICPEISGSKVGKIQSKQVPSLKYVIRTDDVKTPGFLNFSQLYGQPLSPSDYKLDPDSIGLIGQTSGSTGFPNSVPITHRQLANSFDCFNFSFNFNPETRFGVQIPFNHHNHFLGVFELWRDFGLP